jgi:hypothetical protein
MGEYKVVAIKTKQWDVLSGLKMDWDMRSEFSFSSTVLIGLG